MLNFTSIILGILSCLLVISRAAEVRVLGLDKELRKLMSAKMKPRLEFIGKRPATEWRADDAAFFLHELLKKKGFSNSEVDWELPGKNVILLRANLGVKFVLGKISAVGNTDINDDELDSYFSEILTKGSIVKRKNAPYLEDYPAKGATNIANYLKSRGYWDAKVNIVSVRKKTNGKVDIKINIQRGKTHHLLPPKFTNINPIQRANILKAVSSFIGKKATSENISALSHRVHKHYKDLGYQFAELSVSSKNLEGIEISFDIKTGHLYQVRNINVIGNKKTRTSRFRRYTKPLRGQIYKESDANEIAKKLLLTGAFKSVRFIPKKLNNKELDLTLEITEAKPRFIRAYGGFASYDGLVLGASYTNQNFLKKLQTYTARAEISSRGLLGELSLTEPYFAGVPLSQTSRLYAIQRRFDGYKKSQTGMEFAFNWEPYKSLKSRLYASLNYVALESSSLTSFELGPNDYLDSKIGFEQTIDFRNNEVLPTQGFHAKGLFEYGTINGDASNSYFRADLNSSYRHEFQNEYQSRMVFRINSGTILPSDSSDLPIDLRLFNGGADTVRSFGERELGPLSASGDPTGGEAYWNASVEYIHPFNDLFSGSIFYDAGNVFKKASDYTLSNSKHSIGLGLRFDLPVGPARFEYGFNLNREPGEPRGAFHFSIGAQF